MARLLKEDRARSGRPAFRAIRRRFPRSRPPSTGSCTDIRRISVRHPVLLLPFSLRSGGHPASSRAAANDTERIKRCAIVFIFSVRLIFRKGFRVFVEILFPGHDGNGFGRDLDEFYGLPVVRSQREGGTVEYENVVPCVGKQAEPPVPDVDGVLCIGLDGCIVVCIVPGRPCPDRSRRSRKDFRNRRSVPAVCFRPVLPASIPPSGRSAAPLPSLRHKTGADRVPGWRPT